MCVGPLTSLPPRKWFTAFVDCLLYSGTIGTSSALDLFLGRMRALLDGNILKGVNDHAMSEYIRLLAANLKDSQLSSLDKAASLVQDVAMKVGFHHLPTAAGFALVQKRFVFYRSFSILRPR